MKEERMEILNMLKTGGITPEEAERLLSALAEGERQDRTRSEHHGRKRSKEFGARDFFPVKEFGKQFRGLGKTFERTLKSAVGGGFGSDEQAEFRDYETVEFDRNGFAVAPGLALSIRQPKNSPDGGGDVTLIETADADLRVDSDEAPRLKRRGDDLSIFTSGDCTIYVPAVCSSVSVWLYDGDILAVDLSVPVTAITMSGDISLRNVVFGGVCNTMSGDILLRIKEIHASRCEITSMSGDIALGIPDSWSGRVEASTMSGDVDLDFPSSYIEDRSGMAGTSIFVRIGEPTDDSKLRCTTMSGDINVESMSTSDTSHAFHP